jgi:RNA 3'-phosphate cyclase
VSETNAEPVPVNASAGGQVFRTAIGLSALLQKPVRIESIRKNRPKPGLQPQHLTTLKALQQLCGARVSGDRIGSLSVSFFPQKPVSSQLVCNIGTAGSCGLLLQSAFFPSLLAENRIRVSGGTNVPFAPPIEFLQFALLPVLKQMGCRFELELNSHGFFPKGNGSVSFFSKPAKLPLKPLYLAELGKLESLESFSVCASLPKEVAERQARSAKKALSGLGIDFVEHLDAKEKSLSVGSSLVLLACFSSGRVLSGSALGKKGFPAEEVGKQAALQLKQQLETEKAVDEHLSDQLIPFIALAKGKSTLECTQITEHALENISVCEQLLGVKFEVSGKKGEPGEIFVEGIGFKQL